MSNLSNQTTFNDHSLYFVPTNAPNEPPSVTIQNLTIDGDLNMPNDNSDIALGTLGVSATLCNLNKQSMVFTAANGDLLKAQVDPVATSTANTFVQILDTAGVINSKLQKDNLTIQNATILSTVDCTTGFSVSTVPTGAGAAVSSLAPNSLVLYSAVSQMNMAIDNTNKVAAVGIKDVASSAQKFPINISTDQAGGVLGALGLGNGCPNVTMNAPLIIAGAAPSSIATQYSGEIGPGAGSYGTIFDFSTVTGLQTGFYLIKVQGGNGVPGSTWAGGIQDPRFSAYVYWDGADVTVYPVQGNIIISGYSTGTVFNISASWDYAAGTTKATSIKVDAPGSTGNSKVYKCDLFRLL